MAKAVVTIAYRQVIDSSATGSFERGVFNASYEEFLLKSQAYNPEGKFKTFDELKANDGRANSLHYKSGFAVDGFISTLHKQMPFLRDTLERPLLFNTYAFEVVYSDITNKTAHKVAITYISDTLTLIDSIGNYMIMAIGNKKNVVPGENVETFVLEMQTGVSILTYL